MSGRLGNGLATARAITAMKPSGARLPMLSKRASMAFWLAYSLRPLEEATYRKSAAKAAIMRYLMTCCLRTGFASFHVNLNGGPAEVPTRLWHYFFTLPVNR